MATFGKKKRIHEYLYSKPGIFVVLVFALFMATAVYERYSVERTMAARALDAQMEKQALVERKNALHERVEYLSGDRGIEEEIRKHFDVAKEGEQVIILVGEEDTPVVEAPTEDPKKPWYQFW